MSNQLDCPKCGEQFTPQGLSGHVRFKHGLDVPEAQELVEQAKNAVGDATSAEATSGREQAERDGESDPRDGIDDRLDELLRRREQAERARLIAELDGEGDGDGGDPLNGLAETVVAEAVRSSLDGDGDSLTPERVREIVRQESPKPAATDGGGSDPLAAAIENGAGPEELEAIAEAAGVKRTGPSPWEVADRLVDKIEGDTLAQFAGLAMNMVERNRAPPEPDPAPEEPADTQSPADERLEQIEQETEEDQ